MAHGNDLVQALQTLREDNIRKQKRGLHFIAASVVIWAAILMVELTTLSVEAKNLLVFCCSAPMLPLAYLLSRVLKIDFVNADNPLSRLGLIMSVNQILYILIAMWVFAAVPDKMLMVYAMIFGAHLFPYGWLYASRTYYVFAALIPLLSLLLGLLTSNVVLAVCLSAFEAVFCSLLALENSRQARANH